MKIRSILSKFYISKLIEKGFKTKYNPNLSQTISQFEPKQGLKFNKKSQKVNPQFKKIIKLGTMLKCDHEKKIHEESLLSYIDHDLSLKEMDSEKLLLITYNYYKYNLNEFLSNRFIKKIGDLYYCENQLEGLNKDMKENFSYIYFQLTFMTILKKFDSTHNLFSKMVNENFEKTFNNLNLHDKIFITKLSSSNNNVIHLKIISNFYKKLFSKHFNLDTYIEIIKNNPEFVIILNNIHVILRFLGNLPMLMKEELKTEILNIFKTIKNLSTFIINSPENYFSICESSNYLKDFVRNNDLELSDQINIVLYKIFELCDPKLMDNDDYLYIVIGFMSHFSENEDFNLDKINFFDKLSFMLSQFVSKGKSMKMFNYLLQKFYDYYKDQKINYELKSNVIEFKRKDEIIHQFLQLFNIMKNKYVIDDDLRIGNALIIKTLYQINFDKHQKNCKEILNELNSEFKFSLSKINIPQTLTKLITKYINFMDGEDLQACKTKIISFKEDLKKLNFSELSELINILNKVGLIKELNSQLKEEYICHLFKISLDDKLDNYDLNTIMSVLKNFSFTNDNTYLDNFEIQLNKTSQKSIVDSRTKPRKFEEFKLESEVPSFLEKVYMYLNQDPYILMKYSKNIFVKNLCELTHKYCAELLDIHYYNVIYPMLFLNINYSKDNSKILLHLLRTQSNIAFQLSLRDNPENLKNQMKLFCKTLFLLKSKKDELNVLKEMTMILGQFHNYIVIDPKKFENVFKNSNRNNYLKYVYKQTQIIKKEYAERSSEKTRKQFKIMSHNLEEDNFI